MNNNSTEKVMGLFPHRKAEDLIELMNEGWTPPSVEPAGIVRQCSVAVGDDFKSKVARMEKYNRLGGFAPLYYGFTVEALEKLESIGASWFVDHKFVNRFRYAATVGGNSQKSYPVLEKKSNTTENFSRNFCGVLYKGDLPEFVLDRALIMKDVGLEYFTIHSHNPLPVEYTQLPMEDPVLVVWGQHPGIVINEEKCMAGSNCLGVVLAVWEGENEINLNGDII